MRSTRPASPPGRARGSVATTTVVLPLAAVVAIIAFWACLFGSLMGLGAWWFGYTGVEAIQIGILGGLGGAVSTVIVFRYSHK